MKNIIIATSLFLSFNLFASKELVEAAEKDNLQEVERLLGEKHDVNFIYEEKTPLMCAAINGNYKMVKLLIEKGAQVNFSNGSGNTSLMWAAKFGYCDIVNYLLSYGANKNPSNKLNQTALSFALTAAANSTTTCEKKYTNVVKLLFQGDDINDLDLILGIKRSEAESEFFPDGGNLVSPLVERLEKVIGMKPDTYSKKFQEGLRDRFKLITNMIEKSGGDENMTMPQVLVSIIVSYLDAQDNLFIVSIEPDNHLGVTSISGEHQKRSRSRSRRLKPPNGNITIRF